MGLPSSPRGLFLRASSCIGGPYPPHRILRGAQLPQPGVMLLPAYFGHLAEMAPAITVSEDRFSDALLGFCELLQGRRLADKPLQIRDVYFPKAASTPAFHPARLD